MTLRKFLVSIPTIYAFFGFLPGINPKQSTLITAQAKAENAKTAHAQRTAQRQVQWEMAQAQTKPASE